MNGREHGIEPSAGYRGMFLALLGVVAYRECIVCWSGRQQVVEIKCLPAYQKLHQLDQPPDRRAADVILLGTGVASIPGKAIPRSRCRRRPLRHTRYLYGSTLSAYCLSAISTTFLQIRFGPLVIMIVNVFQPSRNRIYVISTGREKEREFLFLSLIYRQSLILWQCRV